jgi:transcriptional regulator with XRE-family HTH domain
MSDTHACEREYDFALILTGVTELTAKVEDALFEVGCDDATLSVQYGRAWMEFSRTAPSLKDAILSAIRDVRKAGIGADVLRVDECDLVTQSDIARRIGRTRQQVHQYVTGERGPGGFPAPACQIAEGAPLWQWCEVSYWLCQNDMIRPEQLREAEVIATINTALDLVHQRKRNPDLVEEVTRVIAGA